MNDEAEKRLRGLLDVDAFHDDVAYHMQIVLFRNWIKALDMAMIDEGLDAEMVDRVINRVVLGMPTAADVDLRKRMTKDLEEVIRNRNQGTPALVFTRGTPPQFRDAFPGDLHD